MNILALEFSSSQRSVAVVAAVRGELHDSASNQTVTSSRTHPSKVLVSEVVEATPGNTMKPLSMVEDALKQACLEREQIECVAIGLGPGSYTGVRVAIALAQGWQLARGVKLLGISSAECIAAEAHTVGLTGRCCVIVDAQREELYLAGYEITATGLREIEPLMLATRAEVREREKAGRIVIGPEATRWFDEGIVVFPRAATLGRLALDGEGFVKGEQLEPIYLRETRFVKAPPLRVVP